MNNWGCSKSTQRDLQRIRRNTQEECSRQFIPTHASDFRLITELVCAPFSIVSWWNPLYKKQGLPLFRSRAREVIVGPLNMRGHQQGSFDVN